VPSATTPPAPASLDFYWLEVKPRTDLTPHGIEATVDADLTQDLSIPIATFGDSWSLRFDLKGSIGTGVSLIIQPPAQLNVDLGRTGAAATGEVFFHIDGKSADPTKPLSILSLTAGSAVQADRVTAGLGAGFALDTNGHASADFGFDGKVDKGKIVIKSTDPDSFIARLLPSDGLIVSFDFGIAWSASKGLYISGGAGLESTFPINLSLGPVTIPSIHLGVFLGTDGLRLELSVTADGQIGPISAAIDRVGLGATLAFKRGNLGPVDFGFKFKPPTGLGIDIDAGPISGGGFITFDPDHGRYAGVLALSLYSIQVKAIGLLDTKLPDGHSGYSFLVIISVEFTPIQLGFGFTLNGVGGLCGINRNFVTDAIQAGLRAHSLDHILFPKDPVKNAPAIISDLRTIFPPAEGRYVFGPMLELGWGGGLNLLTAELGVIIAIPSPVVIAILGQLNINLPNPAAAIVELHLDVLGIVDFGKKLFSLDATLHDSRVVVFTIVGDMAMRLSWGDNPSFALSIGGLNPHFQPPAGFPQLKRLTISLSASDNFRLSIQTYLAITSNTFQFGALAELYVGVSWFNVYGWLGFDALFIFQPFSFIADFTAGLALRSGTSTLFGISLSGELSGTTPWHVKGEAHFTILFFDIGVHVEYTWGETQTPQLPAVDAWPQLQSAIQDVRNWSGALPASRPSMVTLAIPQADEHNVYVDPNGTLTFRERVVPLNQTLTKFGEATPGPQTSFNLGANAVTIGADPKTAAVLPFTVIRDKFAPAQFEQMSDQDKLSRPSFEDRDAGFSFGDDQLKFGTPIGLDFQYEDIYIDDAHTPPPVPFIPDLWLQILWALLNEAAKSRLRWTSMGKYGPLPGAAPLVTFGAEKFVVATTTDLTQRADITHPVTKGEAYQALNAHLTNNPHERELLQVVPLHELAA
jgi:hypothetical protein